MRSSKYLIYVLLFSFLSCSESRNEHSSSNRDSTKLLVRPVPVHDTLYRDSSDQIALQGFYQGTLPCSGCEGSQLTLLFHNKHLYKAEENTWGKKTVVKVAEGYWENPGDSIVLHGKDGGQMTFHQRNDSLFLAGTGESTVVLSRQLSARDNETWQKKMKQGLKFYGVGNEPFWNIEITDRSIVLSFNGEEKKITLKLPSATEYKDSTVYSLDGLNRVVIYNRFCSDGMSDYLYEYKVSVTHKGQVYKGCGVFLNLQD